MRKLRREKARLLWISRASGEGQQRVPLLDRSGEIDAVLGREGQRHRPRQPRLRLLRTARGRPSPPAPCSPSCRRSGARRRSPRRRRPRRAAHGRRASASIPMSSLIRKPSKPIRWRMMSWMTIGDCDAGPVRVPLLVEQVAGHPHRRAAKPLERFEVDREIVLAGVDHRKLVMAVDQRPAVARDMLDHAEHAGRIAARRGSPGRARRPASARSRAPGRRRCRSRRAGGRRASAGSRRSRRLR